MPLHIVLLEPEIPNNTGNIGRLSLATGATLHLIKPFGFELDDKRVKRAGLDYWKYVDLVIYDSADAFFEVHADKPMAFLSSHGSTSYWDIPYTDDLFLIFGKESVGLPKALLETHREQLYKIPIHSTHIRSINLANAVSVVVYEGLRQLGSEK
ncbi:MAG: tRNA (cytidine(34)-2'-O)-methyltransferase [Altibacter sp.]|uniref:tRNA (cytidine(34)-2'-O)-methyltransferase n=1 Tax=Altibacter sp. TaxID=2024823 RepID=UPI001DDC83EB|nr:tRNA (cytidine(34)-2'-O)-methyltransferase [Altibacter sp.]MBZ0327200.1 tRNA (cytidine(34)-2'-O)-methyltransferase [Altibacter sp.]